MITDPIQHLRDMQAKLDRWDGITMTADMAEEYDAEVEDYREAVDRALPHLLAVAEAARAKVACLEALKYCGDEDVADHVVDDEAADAAIIAAVAKLDEVKRD